MFVVSVTWYTTGTCHPCLFCLVNAFRVIDVIPVKNDMHLITAVILLLTLWNKQLAHLTDDSFYPVWSFQSLDFSSATPSNHSTSFPVAGSPECVVWTSWWPASWLLVGNFSMLLLNEQCNTVQYAAKGALGTTENSFFNGFSRVDFRSGFCDHQHSCKERYVFLQLHNFVSCCKFHLLHSSSSCLHLLLFPVVKRSVMKVSDRLVLSEHFAFTLPIQTFWSSFCGGTLHYVRTQLLSQELERTIRLWTHRLHWVTKRQQLWPVLELPGRGGLGRLNPLSSLEWSPSSGIFQWGRRNPIAHIMAVNDMFLIITRPPSTTMHPIYGYFDIFWLCK